MYLCREAMDRYVAPAISAYTPSMAKTATSSILKENLPQCGKKYF